MGNWKSYYSRHKFPTNKDNWFKKFTKVKNELQKVWRKKIFLRDGDRCVICDSEKNLQLAHITSVFEFVQDYAKSHNNTLPGNDLKTTLSKSYRYDNLITLCTACHMVEHRLMKNPAIKVRIEELTNEIKSFRNWSRATRVVKWKVEDQQFDMDEVRPTSLILGCEYGLVSKRKVKKPSMTLKKHTVPTYLKFTSLTGWTEEDMAEQYPRFLTILKPKVVDGMTEWYFTRQKFGVLMNKNLAEGKKSKTTNTRINLVLKNVCKQMQDELNIILKHGLYKHSEEELNLAKEQKEVISK